MAKFNPFDGMGYEYTQFPKVDLPPRHKAASIAAYKRRIEREKKQADEAARKNIDE